MATTKTGGKSREGGTPGLFDHLSPRTIPVSTVQQATYEPTDASTEEVNVSARAPGRKPTRATPRSSESRSATRQPRTAAARKGVRKRRAQPAEADATAPPVTPPRKASRARRPRNAVTAESLAAQQRSISVSEFFAKNRHLLGFDNKRKALLTTVKEAVDNSLDACEEAGRLPDLWITIDQLAEDRFRVTVRDNGPGIVKAQIPNIFGKLLYGSKFHRLKMSRGQQGIGISAAGMYGLLTTGKSVHITSRTGPKREAHHFQIQIDTTKNKPDVIRDETVEVPWDRGTEVSIELIASYAKGRQSVDEYVEQTAIANPHAQISYTSPTREHRAFPRASEELPAEVREIKPHPHGIELGVLMKLLKEAKGVKLAGFLQREFCRVSAGGANAICKTANLSPKAFPSSIGTHDVEKLYEAMQSVRFMAPPTDCLAPIGIRNLLAGLLKEVKAEFFAATTRSPAVYRGNPFQIEVALAYGGSLSGDATARIIRFANRVPLLYQQSACAAFKSVLDVDWRNYGLSQPTGALPVGPLVIMIHMASVWVPFTSESKEAIADYDEIRKEMKLALQECGRKLATYVRRRRRQKLEAQRRDIFSRYIPDVAESLAHLTGQSEERLLRDLRSIARERTADADVVLDEDGKPIEAERTPAPPTDARTLDGDASTVIVPENESVEAPDGLFDSEGNGNGNGKRRRSGRRRRR
jgi:DNA topoisomerase-6 subunit B